jgi:hypothetical protein
MPLSFSIITKCKIISALKIEMFAANPFFKKYMNMDGGSKLRNEKMMGIRDNAAVRVDAHPRYGFKTMLSGSKVPLPSAPAIVGGNVDWTSSKVTPVTHKLFDTLSSGRGMNRFPALGSGLGVGEPHQQSIHTTI